MKEQYFTPQTIPIKAQEFCLNLNNHRRLRRLENYDLNQSALLVLDMQDYFLHPGSHAFVPSMQAIIPGIQSLIDKYHKSLRPIIFSKHINTRDNAGMMAAWWKDMIDNENPLGNISNEIDTSTGTVLEKSQYDAFHATHLDALLQAGHISQVVICGVMTHLCCETTARSAFMHGYEVFFTIDGTATYTEAHHRASLLNLSHGFATPVFISELLGIHENA
jgi:isochorismate hydrolase